MPRYKPIASTPRLLPVHLEAQLVPGTFEHALDQPLDHELDLSDFDASYCNGLSAARAYASVVLLPVAR